MNEVAEGAMGDDAVVKAGGGRWCILRTNGSRTLKLVETLIAADIEAWTPTVMVKRRVPRKAGRVEKPAPLYPTWVFVRYAHLDALFAIRRADISPHPAFSIFCHNGEVAKVSDAEVGKIRLLEAGMKPKRRRPTCAIDAEVRLTEGAYAGLSGVVEASDGKHTLVAFGGWMSVKIETSILIEEGVEEAPRS